MALEPVRLDDLTWEEMVLAIRRRIAAASSQQWTLHAPVDPGVTMLELYAWLLEQRLYWMDQIPPSFVRAAIGLIGESARTTQCATTVFKFTASDYYDIPRRTQLRLANQPNIVFSTEKSLMRIPVERIGLSIGSKDLRADLQHGRVIPLFAPSQSEDEVKITLWLKKPLPAHSAEPLALLFDLQTPRRVPPQWSTSAAKKVPHPAAVKFLYRKSSAVSPVPFSWIDDGTEGLRRSGIVRVRIPDDWTPEGAEGGLTEYALWLRVEDKTFTSPPMLKRLVPNVTIAHHLHRVSKKPPLAVKWPPLPGNEVPLADDNLPLEPAVVLRIRERDQRWHKWSPTPDLAFHGPGDRVFVVDRERGAVRFGDGYTGRLPVPFMAGGSMNVRVRFFAGGGTAGNVGNSLEWEGVKDPALAATNIVRAEGGTDAESPAASSERAAASLRKVTRAVTSEDYEEIALTTPGIAIRRAHAAIGYHPGHPCTRVPGAVTVFVVPDAPRLDKEAIDDDPVLESVFVPAPLPDPGALAAIRARMERMRLITSEVFVLAPRYRHVALKVSVEGDPADPSAIRESIRERLQEFLDPLVGGDKKQGWPFGEPLRPSVLLRESQRALDGAAEVISVSIRLLDDDTATQVECSDVAIGEHELVVLDEINVQLSQTAMSWIRQGGLR